jgi:hypothetical protein
MPFYSKYNSLIINIFICCLLLSSCTQNLGSKKNQEYKTLPEIQESSENNPSLSEQFSESRKKTEYLDDNTETMLNRHKRWFVLGIIGFILLAFQSLINYRKN